MSQLLRRAPLTLEFINFDPSLQLDPEEQAVPRRAQEPIGVVVTGDNHLSPALPRLSPRRRAERRDRLRSGFAAAIAYAIEHNARLFAHVGDLFDTPTPSNQDRAFVASALARLRRAGVTCVAISGNHDIPRILTESGGEAPQRVYAALDGLHYFAETDVLRPRLFTLDGIRIAVAGLGNNPVAPPGSDPLAGVAVEDPDCALAQSDVGLLLLHAAIEDLCMPNEGERTVHQATLDALPRAFQLVVAGHIHRFAHTRTAKRQVVVCGATERMEFGTAAGHAGFAWIELDRDGVRKVEHIRLAEQPRVEISVSTAQLWPCAHVIGAAPISATAEPEQTGTSPWTAEPSDESGLVRVAGSQAVPAVATEAEARPPVETLRQLLAGVCTRETMVRLRLYGPLTLEQYHQLAFRDLLRFGQEHAFSLDLDTAGLELTDPTGQVTGPTTGSGPISPLDELERLVAERLPELDETARADLEGALALLRERIGRAQDAEGGL